MKINFKQYKQLVNLFNRVDNALEGSRYFSVRETRENQKTFIYSIVYKDYRTLLSYIENLTDLQPFGYADDIIRDLKNVMYDTMLI